MIYSDDEPAHITSCMSNPLQSHQSNQDRQWIIKLWPLNKELKVMLKMHFREREVLNPVREWEDQKGSWSEWGDHKQGSIHYLSWRWSLESKLSWWFGTWASVWRGRRPASWTTFKSTSSSPTFPSSWSPSPPTFGQSLSSTGKRRVGSIGWLFCTVSYFSHFSFQADHVGLFDEHAHHDYFRIGLFFKLHPVDIYHHHHHHHQIHSKSEYLCGKFSMQCLQKVKVLS